MAGLQPVHANDGADLEAFFAEPDLTSATLSPSGARVATIRYRDGGQRLSVLRLADGSTQTVLNLSELSEDDAIVSAVAWIDETQLAVQYSELRNGVERLVDSKRISYLLIAQLPEAADGAPRLLRVRTKGRLVSTLPDEEDRFLYAKSGAYSHVYKIDTGKLSEVGARLGKLDKVDGGQFIASNRLASVEGFATRWFIDGSGAPKAALTVNAARGVTLSELGDDGEFTAIKEWKYSVDDDAADSDPLHSMIPVLMAADRSSFYCLSSDKAERNAVFKVDFSSGDKTLVYENDSYAINSLILTEARDDIIGVRVLRDGGLQNVYLGATAGSGRNPGVAATIDVAIDHSIDHSVTLRYREGHAQPGYYYVQDSATGQQSRIGSAHPQLLDALDSELVEGRVSVGGLDIPYLLTLPSTPGNRAHPLVVMPHGGPIGVFDDRYFDLTTQYLAAKGYAVLRVNYRGSSGYSKALREAGKLQWGDLILEDIHAATRAATARPDIDASRVCVFGASYGGYAAVMLAIRHPESYRCASSLAGVSDINLYLATPYASESQRAWLKENVGDRENDYDRLKLASPAYLADRLTRPLQIAHGAEDQVVDVEHAHRLRLALDKYGKPYEFKIFEDQGHQFNDMAVRREFFEMLTRFLEAHISG